MDFLGQIELAENGEFQARVRQAVITADHGFLFQQEPVAANDRSQVPAATELTFKNRRFALGTGIQASAGQKVFSAAALGLGGHGDGRDSGRGVARHAARLACQ
jgi:hypothetical protein